MKRLPDGSYQFSPKDLIAYLEGDYAAWCERSYFERSGTPGAARSAGGDMARDIADAEMKLVMDRGLAHEAAHRDRLRSTEPGLVEIAAGESAREATWRAMQSGAPIIFQGELHAAPWWGIADFLHRLDGASDLGDYHYEPRDTKLARSAKPYFLIQLCAYAEMLERMQGRRPEQFGFIFGDDTERPFRTEDVWHYYRRHKRSFEDFQREWSEDAPPDPGLDSKYGHWSNEAKKHLTRVDDLSLVAGITRSQIVRLRKAGIDTVARLASSSGIVPKMDPVTLDGLRAQAAMQVASRDSGRIEWTFRAADPKRPRRGLALLPPPSANDVFFDIEGFPWAPGGLDYLLGVVTVDEGAPLFHDWWAHDEVQEKRAFEQFVDWAYARWQADRTLHIYHYASYERSALTRLMCKYGTREDQVDNFLRHHVLVDLYPVVRQGMVIGTPSYSLKEVEHLYLPPRTGDVTSAGASVVEYQRWLDEGESQNPARSPILAGIRSYNQIDCESTAGLRDWLLARQPECGISWSPPPPPPVPKEVPETADAPSATVLAEKLLARADGLEEGSEAQRITRLLAWLLEFHRREEKPWWWLHFKRMEMTDQELYDDADCLSGLVRTNSPISVIDRSAGYEYQFDPDQETKLCEGDECAIPGTVKLRCKVERLDRDAGLILLKVGPGKSLPESLALIPAQPIPTRELRKAILTFVTEWSSDPSRHPALSDLLARNPPRLSGGVSLPELSVPNDLTAQVIDAARRLDRSTLCIQGPPGSGKTTAAAKVILALTSEGKRVGIVASGHLVILNLLKKIAELGDECGIRPRLVKVGGEGDHALITSGRATHIESNAAADAIAEGPLVIGGTAWVYARPELKGTLDYLFIEEAGQFSLANAVAVGASTANLILLGDQMQLSQPTQGSHPDDSGLSALEYLLQEHETVPPELGIFLGLSYRMHPDVCRLISCAYYEGRLTSAPGAASHRIVGAAATAIGLESGIRFIPSVHEGRTQGSDEEVDVVAALVEALLTCSVEVKGEPAHRLTLEDILIVAPFNMQVRALKRRLGDAAQIGSVDKFQGKEAPVVILSMCASTIQDAPRGPQFLLMRNRLNVAISRAQALAIVVGSPGLGGGRVRSVEEMELVSGWCRIEECAG